MKLLQPTLYVKKITDITNDLLTKSGIKCVLLDVDSTIAIKGAIFPQCEISDWVKNLLKNNKKIILVSNNFRKRVKNIAEKLNLPCINFVLKPFTFGLKKAIKILNCQKKDAILIGDQIFTDILAANLFGIKSILVSPLPGKESPILKIKRIFEKPILKKLAEKLFEK